MEDIKIDHELYNGYEFYDDISGKSLPKDLVIKAREEEIKQVKELKKKYSASQVGLYFGVTKNSIIGLLYKEKLKDGYVPAPDSKYTVRKNL